MMNPEHEETSGRIAKLAEHHSGYVFAELDGKLADETKEQVKFLLNGKFLRRAIWINKKDLRHITYKKGGDSFSLRIGQLVEAIEIPRWLAGEHRLDVK